jgi:membrane protease YdiL (CAAX protease family)
VTVPDREQDPGWRRTLPIHATMVALLLLTAGFHTRLGMGLLDATFVIVLLVGLPIVSLAQLPLLADAFIERTSAYAGSAITIGVLATVALVLGGLGPGLGAMGLEAAPPAVVLWTTAALAGAALAVMLGFHLLGARTGLGESRLLRDLIPRTGPERGVFAGLSVVAGLGEEIAYRGYLLAILVPAFGEPWTAVGVSSAAFGLLHAYQGGVGIVRTGLLGGIFAASVVLTGTLWPAVLVHTVVDLIGGLWLGPRLLEQG